MSRESSAKETARLLAKVAALEQEQALWTAAKRRSTAIAGETPVTSAPSSLSDEEASTLKTSLTTLQEQLNARDDELAQLYGLVMRTGSGARVLMHVDEPASLISLRPRGHNLPFPRVQSVAHPRVQSVAHPRTSIGRWECRTGRLHQLESERDQARKFSVKDFRDMHQLEKGPGRVASGRGPGF